MNNRQLTRKEKIVFLKNYANGKKPEPEPDLSLLSDDELRFIIQLQKKLEQGNELSSDEQAEISRLEKKAGL